MDSGAHRTFVTPTSLLYMAVIAASVAFSGALLILSEEPFVPIVMVIGLTWIVTSMVWPMAGLIGYSVIMLIRPHEFIPFLQLPIPIEKTVAVPALLGLMFKILIDHRRTGQGIKINSIDKSVAFFVLVALLSVVTAFWIEGAIDHWIHVFRLFVIYLLIAKVISSEKQYRFYVVFVILTTVFHAAAATINYYRGIREFEMGIDRAGGLDASFGDPNSLAATIVYALPLIYFYLMGSRSRGMKILMGVFGALCIWCVILTGSRTGMSGVLFLGFLIALQGKHRMRKLALGALVILAVGVVMPGQYISRLESTVDSTSGTTGAAMSAQSRLDGFLRGARLMFEHPLLGVGVGQYLMAIGDQGGPWIEAHNLGGQLMGDLGMLGVIAFVAWLIALFKTTGRLQRFFARERGTDSLMYNLVIGLRLHVFCLLWMGVGGHNLYRYNWYVLSALIAAMLYLPVTERLSSKQNRQPQLTTSA